VSQYPVILLPEPLSELKPLTAKPIEPVRPVAPRKPKPLPPAPHPVNFQRLIIHSLIATAISLILGGMVSLFNASFGGGLGIFLLLASLGFFFLRTIGEKQSFNRRYRQYEQLQQSYLPQFEAYSQQLAQYEQAKQTYPIAIETYQQALQQWQQEIQQFRQTLAQNLRQAQSYQGIDNNPRRGSSEKRFEAVLKKYWTNKIKIGVKLQNPNYDIGYHYVPDFAYIDEEINLYIDIEIDEPYGYKSREPIHYLGAENEQKRHDLFLNKLWVIIRFSEEQTIRYPQSCCKVIAEVIAQITGDNTALSQLSNEPDLPLVDRWDYEEAAAMERQDYRKTYLR
jgi:hypothetical protein